MFTDSDTVVSSKDVAIKISECSISDPAPTTKKKSKKKKSSSSQGSGDLSFSGTRSKLIKVSISVDKGRSLIANSDLVAGTQYFSEKAVATVSHEGELCTECGSVIITNGASVFMDSNLTLETFCSEKCREDCCGPPTKYRFLDVVNKNLAQCASSHNCDKDLLRIVFKLLLLSADDTQTHASLLWTDNGTTIQATVRGLQALEPHLDTQPAEWRAAVSSGIGAMLTLLLADATLQEALSAFGTQHNPDSANTMECLTKYCLFLACIVNVNAYGIVNYSSTKSYSLGFGLFPAVGLCVNHSCTPNSYFSYNTATGCMEYRTIRNVRTGEELTVSYADIFQDTTTRRDYILSKRFFLCKCERCSGLDLVTQTVTDIVAASRPAGSTEAGGTKKKGAKAEEEQSKQRLSPFYKSLAAAEEEDWMNEPSSAAAATTKAAKGKTKAAPAPASADNAACPKKAAKGGVADVALSVETRNSIVADSMLAGLFCDHCGTAGVIVSVAPKAGKSTETGTEQPGCAACIVCAKTAEYQQCLASLERCRAQWGICSSTAQYTTAGLACVVLVEKFLQEADPEYALYGSCALATRCADFRDAHCSGAAHTASAAGGASAQAQAQERRRKLKCPVQLHPHHVLLDEAYKLLHEHLLVHYRQAENSGQGASVVTPLLARALYAQRRVIRAHRSLLLPLKHPEVGALQCELACLLEAALRHCTKGSATAKELRKECAELLSEVIESRTHAFGLDHELTTRAKEMLTRLK